MRLSLVIPTRERCELLRPCLEAALSSADPDLEVVVSDNLSADGTADLLASIDDPRLKVVRPEGRVAMRLNFETGLRAATGDYVIFIGDDDGVSSAGLAVLRRLLERDRPEAVNWEMLAYTWPSASPGGECGLLQAKYKAVYGGVGRRPATRLLDRLCGARLRNYKETANIYHGCISREVIERVRAANGGTYFAGAIPDVYAGIANLVHMRGNLLWLSHPVTFGGASDRSNGAAQMSATRVSDAGETEKKRFESEATSDPGTAELHVNTPSVNALTLDMLRLVNRQHADGRLSIDHDGWFRRILQRMARMPAPAWQTGIANLSDYADRIGETAAFKAAQDAFPHRGAASAGEGRRPTASRIGMDRMMLAHPTGLATVADAVRAVEHVFGTGHDPRNPASALARPFRWLGARRRAQAMVAEWDRSA